MNSVLTRTAATERTSTVGVDAPRIFSPTGQLRGEILGSDALEKILPAWGELCSRSIEDNVYYSPKYAKALLESIERNNPVRFAVVWDKEELVALLPFTRPKHAIPMLQPRGQAWQTKYTYSCMPLLDRFRTLEAADVLVETLASAGADEWIIPTINIRGSTCQALVLVMEKRAAPWTVSNYFKRAVLDAGVSFDEHIKNQMTSSRRKSLNRNRRRLEEIGRVEHVCHTSGQGLTLAVSAFLTIEASGWKGKRGTALACNEWTRKFAMDAFGGKDAGSICRADVLTLDGSPIAVSLIVVAGTTGFAVKCAYDETYRSYSPGLILELEVVRSFLSGNWARRLDGATAGVHAIDDIWSGQTEVADLLFSLAPNRAVLRLSAVNRAARFRDASRAAAKRLIGRLSRP